MRSYMDSPKVVVVVWVHSTNNNKSVSSAVKFNCMNYSQTQIWIFNLIRMYYNYKTENCTVRSPEYETTESLQANYEETAGENTLCFTVGGAHALQEAFS